MNYLSKDVLHAMIIRSNPYGSYTMNLIVMSTPQLVELCWNFLDLKHFGSLRSVINKQEKDQKYIKDFTHFSMYLACLLSTHTEDSVLDFRH
jgi:hypothetical protein